MIFFVKVRKDTNIKIKQVLIKTQNPKFELEYKYELMICFLLKKHVLATRKV